MNNITKKGVYSLSYPGNCFEANLAFYLMLLKKLTVWKLLFHNDQYFVLLNRYATKQNLLH